MWLYITLAFIVLAVAVAFYFFYTNSTHKPTTLSTKDQIQDIPKKDKAKFDALLTDTNRTKPNVDCAPGGYDKLIENVTIHACAQKAKKMGYVGFIYDNTEKWCGLPPKEEDPEGRICKNVRRDDRKEWTSSFFDPKHWSRFNKEQEQLNKDVDEDLKHRTRTGAKCITGAYKYPMKLTMKECAHQRRVHNDAIASFKDGDCYVGQPYGCKADPDFSTIGSYELVENEYKRLGLL